MKNKLIPLLFGLLALAGGVVQAAQPLGTAINYQGRLTDGGSSANGTHSFRYRLVADPAGTAQIGSIVDLPNQNVSGGLFNATLDFGAGAFNGQERWLEISVKTGGPGAAQDYIKLNPQPLPPGGSSQFARIAGDVLDGTITGPRIAPLAVTSGNLADGAVTATKLAAGSVGSSQIADGSITAADIANGQVVKSLSINGSGNLRDTVNLAAGSNVMLTPIGNTVTISSAGPGGVGIWTASGGNTYYTAGRVGIGTANPDARLHSVGIGGNISGVRGESSGVGNGVEGFCDNAGASGVYGENKSQGFGIAGRTTGIGYAVYGDNQNPTGWAGLFDGKVFVRPNTGVGLQANSQDNNGVFGYSISSGASGVYGQNDGQGYGVAGRTTGTGIAVYGDNRNGAGWAGAFAGNVLVDGGDLRMSAQRTIISSGRLHIQANENLYLNPFAGAGDVIVGGGGGPGNFHVVGSANVRTLTIRGGADLAEPFPMKEEQIDKGSVVVIDEEHTGRLKLSTHAYDTQVAGIVSGANGINPGISLTQEGALDSGHNVALTGRVYVKADASHGAIKPGDLLTTSDTPGHAMKVTEHARAQGAILGKAMGSLKEGTGLVLVLVTLQ